MQTTNRKPCGSFRTLDAQRAIMLTSAIVVVCLGMIVAFGLHRKRIAQEEVAKALATAQPTPEFRKYLDEFLREATRIQVLTDQGVTHERYGEHLANTTAAFVLLAAAWPERYELQAKAELTKALEGWRLLNVLWEEEIRYKFLSWTNDYRIINALDAYAPGRIQHNSAMNIPFEVNIRLLMRLASEHCTRGRNLIFQGQRP